MRGKAANTFSVELSDRITPAHAGKSMISLFLGFSSQDHPRTCGEKYSYFSTFLKMKGSPPHMRGKVIDFLYVKESYWITPAHAGKSLFHQHFSAIMKDHPRTCGEKLC